MPWPCGRLLRVLCCTRLFRQPGRQVQHSRHDPRFAAKPLLRELRGLGQHVLKLVPVHGLIDNQDGRWRANQVGTATVVLGPATPAVLVPHSAVQYDGPTAYVFIQRTPTIFRGLPVQVLGTTPDGLAVSRVLPGDTIAVSGTAVLKGNLFQEKFGPGCCVAE